MTAILPISTVRVSDSLIRSRLTQQVQSDQLELFRVQNQISTGRRIFSPSEDAPSALRAITLQRNLERQEQVQRNLSAADDVLSAAGSALSETGSVLTDIRGAALSVAGTDASQEQRDAVVAQVEEAIDSLLRFGNSTFRDNYLFGGTQGTSSPYVALNGYVEYRGNEETLQSYVDTGLLFDVNVSGQEAFGGISEAVRGTTDLAPQLTANTLVSQLNGGAGISKDGAIQIDFVPDSPGGVVTESTTIDLRAASTIGDVARLIEAGSPPSADVRVSITGGSLTITTNGAVSGGVVISEVGQGRTASDLGIVASTASNNITGGDLDPSLRSTTQLDTLLGTRSQARLISSGDNNDLIITATENGVNTASGDPLNGITIQYVDGGAGYVTDAAYDAIGSTLTVTIDGSSPPTAAEVADAINAEPNGYFSAAIDPADALTFTQAGQGAIELAATATTSGGSGTTLDLASGLVIENGDGPVVVDTSGAETVFDLLEVLNDPDLGLTAQLNASGSGIDVRTRRSGANFAIGENGGQLAAQLGLRTYTEESRLEDFNRGLGVAIRSDGDEQFDTPEAFAANNVFEIEITDEAATTTYSIDLTNVTTVNDLIAQITTDTAGAVQASLATTGNGLVLSGTNAAITTPTAASGSLSVGLDTLTFDAVSTGFAGNQDFTIDIVDDGVSGRSVSVVGNVITVELGGTTPDTATLAAEIDAQLTDFNVTSTGPADPVTVQAGLTVSTTGGQSISAAGADNITVSGAAAQRLGFFGANETSASGVTVTAEDRNTLEVDSAFNTLIRLRDALEQGDVPAIGAAVEQLDIDLNRSVFAESEVGARVQTLQVLEGRLEDEEIQLRTTLSEEIEVDLTEAISEFTARQYALQASLQTTANILQLSLLDFI